MTIPELEKRPDFVTLSTAEQKVFVVEYCSNGADKIGAAETAYKCKDRKVALATANRALRHPAISKLVGDFYEKDLDTGDKESALAMIWKRLQGSLEDKDFVGLMNLYGKWKGFEAPKPTTVDPPEDPESIDDLVREMEKKRV